MSNDAPHVREQKEAFLCSVRRYQWVSIFVFGFAGLAMLAIMACLIPFHEQFKAFFDKRIGGDLGDAFRGLSFALIASPPMIAAIYWMRRRIKWLEKRCTNCSTSLAAAGRVKFVVRTNRCPLCDTIVFPLNDNVSNGQSGGIQL